MACPSMPVERGAGLFERWALRYKDNRIPLIGSCEITARCNLRCAHCYINMPSDDAASLEKELSTSQWYNIIDQIVDSGCLFLLMTGGEVFLRPDFMKIYNHAKSKGLLVIVYTNGTTLTSAIVEQLADLPPRLIEITLNGITEATFDRVTGVAGSYRRCMRGIELLLEKGLPLGLKTTVSMLNQHEIDLIRSYVHDLGLKYRFDAALNMRLDGGRQPGALRLIPEEVIELDLADAPLVEQLKQIFLSIGDHKPSSNFLYECGAARNLFHVDSYGMMTPCMMSRMNHYDLLTGSFEETWNKFFPELLAIKRLTATQCDNCKLAFMCCGKCPGWAELENGDPEQPVKYLCDINCLRLAAFGRNEPDSEHLATLNVNTATI